MSMLRHWNRCSIFIFTCTWKQLWLPASSYWMDDHIQAHCTTTAAFLWSEEKWYLIKGFHKVFHIDKRQRCIFQCHHSILNDGHACPHCLLNALDTSSVMTLSSTEFCSGFNKDTLCCDTAEEFKFALMEFALKIKVALSSLTGDNHNSSSSRA